MKVLKEMDFYGHERVVFVRNDKVNLRAIIAVHDTSLGPALGGTRFWNYETEEDALYDVLRLSKGMTLKNAAANLKLGGGKAVIIGDPAKLKSREFFNAYGQAVNELGGTYYTAEDVNIRTADVAHMNEVTKFVAGTPDISGDPSPFTARGTFQGLKAGAKEKFGSDDVSGKVVAIQGLGSVGYGLAEYLSKAGAKLKVFDINQEAVKRAVKELGAEAVSNDEILITDCDILAPCALGAVISVKNAPQIKAKVVAGCANNVFVDEAAATDLDKRGVLYCPDYIINAGGVINCGAEITDDVYDVNLINKKVDEIYDTTLKIFRLAKEQKITTYKAAEEYAMGIVLKARK